MNNRCPRAKFHTMMKKKAKIIVLATHNRDKIREFREKIGNSLQLKTLDDYPDLPEVSEDGNSIRENAYLKARAVHAFSGLPAIADDTGLEVDALNGAPGIYSSRFAGENASYRDNVLLLLERMNNIPQEQRSACFRTSIAYVDNQESWDVEGRVEGRILQEAKGDGGFGYDPVFFYEPLQKTFSELDLKEKNRISHRGKALDAFIHTLKIKKYL
ncbi:MAG: RdgB/HAM1 family non-canonical purine NTP pyrophosphatase [Candidatus Marinimicrobia bacterium]|nr:RdgB/HAM1 family non-canonical purine NTP pyrophosphatase [Candidatus Neomarinimicrobiota bacterium]